MGNTSANSNLDATTRIGFGGGCHWCTEAVFASLSGVRQVQQGFASSHPPDDQYSEAVLVDFDNQCIPLDVLIEIHLRTHSSSSAHPMRKKYRSAVYVSDAVMVSNCVSLLDHLQRSPERPVITQVLQLIDFRLSPEQYRNYYFSDPAKPFCSRYIEPKLAMLKRQYSGRLKPHLP